MKNENKLSDVWLKASVLGATWAASEIILGSFLHNLHIPFKGNILTAIGLILLITASYRWKNKGLFWRSGLICALMKTMSPSAVIFGPMVAIFMEALLLEFSVRMLGRNMFGFIMGSVLAMSWVLLQKVTNLLIFYSFNIIEIYDNLLKYIQQQLSINSDIFWFPLIILLGLYSIFGIVTAIIGVKTGRDFTDNKEEVEYNITQKACKLQSGKQENFPYSISWLALSFAGIIGCLLLINKGPVYVWMPVSGAFVTAWVLRYKRGMRQLARFKFWVSFVIITVLSAMLITSVNGSNNSWLDGLMIGLEMNTRAIIVIIGFTVLGTELYNPKIRNFIANSTYRQLSTALELAFESLPFVVGHLPKARAFITRPVSVIRHLIFHAENRLKELENKQQPAVFVISGDISEGKTTFLAELVRSLQTKCISVGGFYAPRIMQNRQTTGYNLVSVETGEHFTFLDLKKVETDEGIGKYALNLETQKYGKRLLDPENIAGRNVIIIDEIGKLELNDHGWKSSLESLLTLPNLCLILAVRKEFITAVVEKFNINKLTLLPLSKTTVYNAESKILNSLRKEKNIVGKIL